MTHSEKGLEAPCPFPVPHPMPVFHLTVPELHPLKQNVSLSLVSFPSILIEPKEGVSLWPVSQKHR